MFTRNWYNGLAVYWSGLKQESGWKFRGLDGGANFLEMYMKSSSSYPVQPIFTFNNSFPGNGVSFGDGSVPPTLDDYTLSGSPITTLSITSAVIVSNNEDDASITGVYTITNTGSDEVTIREVAMFRSVPRYTSGNFTIMLDRTVLDNPVTIPAGGIGQVTYTIRLNCPTLE